MPPYGNQPESARVIMSRKRFPEKVVFQGSVCITRDAKSVATSYWLHSQLHYQLQNQRRARLATKS